VRGFLQVFDEYSRYAEGKGLSPEGLAQIYADGIGNADVDFATLGLSLVRLALLDPEEQGCKPRGGGGRQHPEVLIWGAE